MLQIGLSVKDHGDVVEEIAFPFDVHHDSGIATGLDELLPLTAHGLAITLDDDSAERPLAFHQYLRILVAVDRNEGVIAFAGATERDEARLDAPGSHHVSGQGHLTL